MYYREGSSSTLSSSSESVYGEDEFCVTQEGKSLVPAFHELVGQI